MSNEPRPTQTVRERLRTILAITRAEYRSTEHRHTKSRRKQALLAVTTAVLLPAVGFMLWGSYRAGLAVASGELPGLLEFVRWYLPGAVVSLLVIGSVGVHKFLLDFEAKELLLTTVNDRDLVLGLLLRGTSFYFAVYAGGAALVLGAFGYGAGTPLVAAVGGTAAGLLVLSGTLTGFAFGLLVRYLLRRLSTLPGPESLYETIGQVAVFTFLAGGGALVGSSGAEVSEGMSLSEFTPEGPPLLAISYYADVLLSATPLVDGIPAAAVGSALLFVVSIPLSVGGILWLAPRLWRADQTSTGDASEPTTSAGTSDTSYLDLSAPLLGAQTTVIVYRLFHRIVRLPDRFVFVAYYFMAIGSLVGPYAVADPDNALLVVGGALVLLGIWLAGGVFGLNPVGEEGTMLGQLVLSDTPAKVFLRARIVAGFVLGLPFVIVGTGVLALTTLTAGETLLLGSYWVGLLPVSGAAALGLGTFLPNSETKRILDSVETRPPERIAIGYHGFGMAILGVAGPILLLGPVPAGLRVVGAVTLAVLVVLLADGSYRFGVDGIGEYGQPRSIDPVFTFEVGIGLALLAGVLSVTVPSGVALLLTASEQLEAVTSYVASFVGWAVIVAAYQTVTDRRYSLDVRIPTASDLRVGSLAVFAALVVAALVTAGQLYGVFTSLEQSLVAEATEPGPWLLPVLIGVGSVVAAPVAEFLFRNGIQKRFATAFSSSFAIGATGLIFALSYVPVYGIGTPAAVLPSVAFHLLLGLVCGVAYARTENIVVPIACHGVYKSALFVGLYVTSIP